MKKSSIQIWTIRSIMNNETVHYSNMYYKMPIMNNEKSIIHYLLYCPLCLVACRAATKVLHWHRSCANFSMVPQVWPMVFNSLSTVLLHVVLGLPLFRLPSGVQCNAVLVIELLSFLITCPSHFHLLLVSIVAMSSRWHLRSRSSLLIFLGQKILRMKRRHFVWKVDSFFRSSSVILQHSDPYNSVGSMQLLYSFILVLLLYWLLFHTLHKEMKTLCALPILFLMSLLAPPSWHTVLPR